MKISGIIRTLTVGAAAVMLTTLAASPAAASLQRPKHYRAITLSTIAGVSTIASALNDRDQVVGTFRMNSRTHGLLWNHGKMTDLGASPDPRCPDVLPVDINNRGQVVGVLASNDDTMRCGSFIWQRGHMTSLGSLGGKITTATAINDRGQVVGSSYTATNRMHAFLWQNGHMRDLGPTDAVGINNRGQVAGNNSHGGFVFLLQRGRYTALPAPAGGWSIVDGIDAHGHVIGEVSVANLPWVHAYLWYHGRSVDLGTLGGTDSYPYAINDRGQVVGLSSDAAGRWRGFLWQCNRMMDLTRLGVSAVPVDINNLGHIIGDVRTTGGISHATLFI